MGDLKTICDVCNQGTADPLQPAYGVESWHICQECGDALLRMFLRRTDAMVCRSLTQRIRAEVTAGRAAADAVGLHERDMIYRRLPYEEQR